ncbi:glycosyltransferase family 2 protein [Acetobacter persici]|uniref:glycosyltransferase family 2 protein n=1 Tax=Acetobacter persici TaxID=1076596 RepID=UPI0039E893EE
MKKYQFSVVACARWESAYILEWLTYYKSIGYDHVYLYCNDDTPDELYEKILPFVVGKNPFVTFIDFAFKGLQHQMYLHFLTNYHHETEWVSFFDIDEFLSIPAFADISDLVSHYPDADCIVFYWLVFGHNGFEKNPSGNVLENYNRRSLGINEYTKYICKSNSLIDEKIFSTLGFGFWHNPVWHSYKHINAVDVIGRNDFSLANLTENQLKYIENTANIHHYMIKSFDYLKHRVERGTSGSFSGQVIWDTSEESQRAALTQALVEYNAQEDNSLTSYWKDQIKKAYDRKVNLPAVEGTLLSYNKPCSQSSISEWSIGKDIYSDAKNAVNGIINGLFKFHTSLENNPWWEIDLEKVCHITDIVIYNVSDTLAKRCKNIKIEFSSDGHRYNTLIEKTDSIALGSLLTHPFHVSINFHARFIKIISLDYEFLHLDQVLIYGIN